MLSDVSAAFMLIYESIVLSIIAGFVLRGIHARFRTPGASQAMGIAAVVVYVTWGLTRYAHAPLRPLLVWLTDIWVSLGVLALVVGLPWLIVRWVIRLFRSHASRHPIDTQPTTRGRREFLESIALPAAALSLGSIGSVQGLTELVVKEHTIRIRNWPKALDGFRIGQVTDTHVGDFIGPEWVAHAVELLNAAQVHLQVMTGDLLDDLSALGPSFRALELCRAPLGMCCVLGNHEKMHHRLQPMLAAYQASKEAGRVRLLVDESEVLVHNGAPLQLVGVDYPMHVNGKHVLPKVERLELMQRSAHKAFASVNPAQPLLCLSHHPDFFPLAQRYGAQLTLSGHTHGGQVALLGRPLLSPYDFMLGHYRRGNSHLYVSGGAGHWFPFRFGVPMEVAVITVRSGAVPFTQSPSSPRQSSQTAPMRLRDPL